MKKSRTLDPTPVPASWGRPARWIRRLAVNVHGLHLVWLNIPRPFRLAIGATLISSIAAHQVLALLGH